MRNKLIRVRRKYTFYWYIDCNKILSLIHWFSILIDQPSYN